MKAEIPQSQYDAAATIMELITERVVNATGPLTINELTSLWHLPKEKLLAIANEQGLTPYEWTLIQCALYWMKTMNKQVASFTRIEQMIAYIGTEEGSTGLLNAKKTTEVVQEHLTFEKMYQYLVPLLSQQETRKLVKEKATLEERVEAYAKLLAQISIQSSPDYYRWLFGSQDFGFTWDEMQEYLTK